MKIVVTGSIAFDYLMSFPGTFTEHFLPEHMQRVSLSFLVDTMDKRRGGCAPNIAYTLALLEERPLLMATAGEDFGDYRQWLEAAGIDTSLTRQIEGKFCASFFCSTDVANNQIASFYTGAMSEARNIELGPVAERVGGLDLVVISPNDPLGMLRHTAECRERGIAFAADPSQQLARMDGPDICALVDGASYLFTNEYEKALTEQKTGWSDDEVLSRVEVRVTTLGSKGARVERVGEPPVTVSALPVECPLDPTGGGDAFRAGFFSAVAWGLPLERAAQLGNMIAVHALEAVGPQEYELKRAPLLDRFAAAYGEAATAEIAAHL